jgi:hypothetical protein
MSDMDTDCHGRDIPGNISCILGRETITEEEGGFEDGEGIEQGVVVCGMEFRLKKGTCNERGDGGLQAG